MYKASIIVCTYNREKTLKLTLEALTRQVCPEQTLMEIIIVDNNSTDNTRELVNTIAESSPIKMRYCFEKAQGKSYALNRGIHEAEGDYLLFTDDDVIPEENWAKELMIGFNSCNADVVGGKVLPLWTKTPPKWITSPTLKRNFNGILALLDHGDEIIEDTDKNENFLFGANIAIKKDVFEKLGYYRTDLGPSGDKLFRGEDTEMMKRILEAGMRVFYFPAAAVKHHMDHKKLKLSYARRRRFYGGQSDFHRIYKGEQVVKFWFVRECFTNGIKAMGNYLFGRKESGIEKDLLFWAQFGRIVGSVKYGCSRKEQHQNESLQGARG